MPLQQGLAGITMPQCTGWMGSSWLWRPPVGQGQLLTLMPDLAGLTDVWHTSVANLKLWFTQDLPKCSRMVGERTEHSHGEASALPSCDPAHQAFPIYLGGLQTGSFCEVHEQHYQCPILGQGWIRTQDKRQHLTPLALPQHPLGREGSRSPPCFRIATIAALWGCPLPA